jgi:uncharacterized protein DUF4019
MRPAILMSVGVTIALSLTACGVPASAKALGERYFEALKQGDYKTIDALYSAYFYQSTTKDQIQSGRVKLREKLGEYQKHELLNAFANWSRRRDEPEGDYTTLQYKVTYAKGTAKETFVVFAPKGGGDPMISGWNIRWEVPLEQHGANRGE